MYNIVHHFQPRRAGARLQRRPHARLIPLRVLLALIVTHHHAAPRACSSISQGGALICIRHLRQRLMPRWQRQPGQRQLLAGRRRKGSTKLSTSSMKPLSSSKTAASVALPPESRPASSFLGRLELGVPSIKRVGFEEMAPPYLVLKMVQCSKQDCTVLRTTC